MVNDEPGRLVEDAAGRIHVALRRGNSVIDYDSKTGQILGRRAACNEPRGIAYDSSADTIHVACASGELVAMPAAGGDLTRRLVLDRDLRDVIVTSTGLTVTRFRTAEILTLDATGAITSRVVPPTVQRADFSGLSPTGMVPAVPAVAWRTIALPDGRLVMSHQRQLQKQLDTTVPGGYGGGCTGGGPDEASVAVIRPNLPPLAVLPPASGALPIDIAINRNGSLAAILTAGNDTVTQVNGVAFNEDHGDHDDPCPQPGGDDAGAPFNDQLGKPTSVAYMPDNSLAIFYPEAPAIVVHAPNGTARTFALPGGLGYDSGRNLFHTQTQVGLACASCHPEGRDDGLVWTFAETGARRTQSVAGGILSRGPYHWAGDEADLPKLMDDVFGLRMNGGVVSHSQKAMLGPWLDRVPAPQAPPVADTAARDRGKTLFESVEVGCTGCHSGALMTNNTVVDVGKGKFKVPSLLGVGARPPYMHDGCAATLADRFGSCGGGDLHGHTSQLTQAQIGDLIAYLGSL
jgi:hypothetical protein